ncbi:DEAD/DEAH box helicase family protein [Turicibacter sanguinis]|jgi:hypothetical protein|uniref:DEAD/DEAH box helicase family protein n=1 Tax=Turicibacter sanguinis TaxID=154288 RepID=UPI00325AE46A
MNPFEDLYEDWNLQEEIVMLNPDEHRYLSDFFTDEQLENMLENCKVIYFSCGCGKGKTFLMERLLNIYADRIFTYFTPRKKLQQQINNRLSDYPNVEVVTIQKFLIKARQISQEKRCLIIDEFQSLLDDSTFNDDFFSFYKTLISYPYPIIILSASGDFLYDKLKNERLGKKFVKYVLPSNFEQIEHFYYSSRPTVLKSTVIAETLKTHNQSIVFGNYHELNQWITVLDKFGLTYSVVITEHYENKDGDLNDKLYRLKCRRDKAGNSEEQLKKLNSEISEVEKKIKEFELIKTLSIQSKDNTFKLVYDKQGETIGYQFTTDFLLCTRALDTGLNIYADEKRSITSIVVSDTNPSVLEQMIGRFRGNSSGEKANVYYQVMRQQNLQIHKMKQQTSKNLYQTVFDVLELARFTDENVTLEQAITNNPTLLNQVFNNSLKQYYKECFYNFLDSIDDMSIENFSLAMCEKVFKGKIQAQELSNEYLDGIKKELIVNFIETHEQPFDKDEFEILLAIVNLGRTKDQKDKTKAIIKGKKGINEALVLLNINFKLESKQRKVQGKFFTMYYFDYK